MEHKISNELPPLPNSMGNELLPSPSPEATQNGAERQFEQAVESGSTRSAPIQAQFPQPTSVAQPLPVATSDGSMPVIADDADLIEKEWVAKAKEIVERTRHDPYEQNKEVEKMKADYMKKRYNREIKITED